MNSLSKTRLSPATINDLTRRAFGESAAEIAENESGCFSALYFVKLAEREVVLKVAPRDNVRVLRYEKNVMRAETDALRLVLAETDVPAPGVLYYDASRDMGDYEYFFMERVSGENFSALSPQMSAGQKSGVMFEMGKLNRKINGVTGGKFGYLARVGRQSESWRAAFEGMVSDILADGKDAGVALPAPYREIEGLFGDFTRFCDDVKTPRLVHWDLWPGNVLVEMGDENGNPPFPRITGVVDWERALWADPLMEYAFREKPPNRDFLAGYGADIFNWDTLPSDKSAAARLALYDLYLALIWKIECRYRGYEDSPQNIRSEGKITEARGALEKLGQVTI